MNNVFAFIGLMIVGLIIGLLPSYIIVDLSDLYRIPFLNELSFTQVYGLAICIGIMKFKPEKPEDTDEDGKLKLMVYKLFVAVVTYLLIWGVAYIMYSVIV